MPRSKVGKQTQKIREKESHFQKEKEKIENPQNIPPQLVFNADLLKSIQTTTNQISGLVYLFSNESPFNNFLTTIFYGVLEHKTLKETFHQMEVISEKAGNFYCINVLQPGNRLNRIVFRLTDSTLHEFIQFHNWASDMILRPEEKTCEIWLTKLKLCWFSEVYLGFYQYSIIRDEKSDDLRLAEICNQHSYAEAGNPKSFNWRFLEALQKFQDKIVDLTNKFDVLSNTITRPELIELQRVIREVMKSIDERALSGETVTQASFENILKEVAGRREEQME